MIDTVKEIEIILKDYFKDGSKMSIDTLLNLQDKLSIHSYRLAEMTADSKNTYNGAYFIRKVTINKQVQSLISKNLSKAAAQVEAETKNEELMKNELESEAEAYKYDILLGQVNRVLSAMQQRISYLKMEKE